MKKFILLLHDELEKEKNYSPDEMQQLIEAHVGWSEKIAEKGMLLGGEGLEADGKFIVGNDSVVKDGPYMEAKEIVGGFYLLQANSLEDVIEVAKECPCHLWGGKTEIRAVVDYDQFEE